MTSCKQIFLQYPPNTLGRIVNDYISVFPLTVATRATLPQQILSNPAHATTTEILSLGSYSSASAVGACHQAYKWCCPWLDSREKNNKCQNLMKSETKFSKRGWHNWKLGPDLDSTQCRQQKKTFAELKGYQTKLYHPEISTQ